MRCSLLPISPFSASPFHRLRPSFLFLLIPWPLGIEPVAQEPGFGVYVGRPPVCGELSGPRWPWPVLRSPPSPLMGKLLPTLLLSRPGLPLLPPHLRFVLQWGGDLRRFWGCPPISWFRPYTKGMRACLGGAPPSHLGCCPDPLLSSCCVLGAHPARGVPSGRWFGFGALPIRACRALRAHAD